MYWYIRYRTPDGKSTEHKASTDKSVAKSMQRDLDAKLQRIKMGLLDPREASAMEAEGRPVAEHVQNYLAHLTARGNTPESVDGVRRRLTWLLEETKISRLSQIRPSLAQSALKTLKDAHKPDRTLFHYAAAWKAFTRWLKKDRRAQEDLLADLDRPTVLEERKRDTLTPEQSVKLVQATRSGPVRRGMTGEDRSWLYVLAMTTGFRRGELQALTPESLSLEGPIPTVALPGSATKNGKPALQPLPAHLATALKDWLFGRPPAPPLFPADRNSAVMIRADLRAAGIPSNPYTFHSLRHSYVSRITDAGATVKDSMELARHSDPDLTFNRYSHARLESLAAVVNRLPTLMAGSCGQAIPYANLPTVCPPSPSQGDSASPTKNGPGETRKDRMRPSVQYARQDLNL
ncbi:MAG: tyrosine-type recombinase/integrase [Isosphaeraceae bacterium]